MGLPASLTSSPAPWLQTAPTRLHHCPGKGRYNGTQGPVLAHSPPDGARLQLLRNSGTIGTPSAGKLPPVLQPLFRKHKAERVKDASFCWVEISPWLLFHASGLSGLHLSPCFSFRNLQHLSVHHCLVRVSAFDPTSDTHTDDSLKAGSPIIIVEAPPILKTAEPMPMLRPNAGLIKTGDAGRIISRRPKDVWAIRFTVGAFLIDRKYFKPLDIS